MIPRTVDPAPPLERILGIRERFAGGGSTSAFVVVLLLIAATFLLLAVIAVIARRWRRRRVYSPRGLFLQSLRELALTVPQRELLRRIARELRLEHPTILLLSPTIFVEHANAWMSTTRNANLATRDRLSALARAIFGQRPIASAEANPDADAS
jgi:hypothetical protein